MKICSFKEFLRLDEGGLSRIYSHLQDRHFGTITAFRDEYTRNENRQRNSQLQSQIRQAGFGFYTGEGQYIENEGTPEARAVREDVFIVIGDKGDDGGKLKSFLKKVGTEWDQDAILYKSPDDSDAQLIGLKSDGWPGKNVEVSTGTWNPNLLHKFYTFLRRGRKRGWSFQQTPPELKLESFKQSSGFFGRWINDLKK